MIIRKAHRRTWLLCRTPMGLIFLCPRIQGYYCSQRNPLYFTVTVKALYTPVYTHIVQVPLPTAWISPSGVTVATAVLLLS